MSRLVIDLETHSRAKGGPDMRVDEPYMVGWLREDEDVGHWSSCLCPLPPPAHMLCHNAMYDVGILSRYLGSEWLRSVRVDDTMLMAYALGYQDLSLKGLGQTLLRRKTITHANRSEIGDEQYLGQDLFLTRDLFHFLRDRVTGEAYDIDRALVPVLVEMSYRGYAVDQDRLQTSLAAAEAACVRAEAHFQAAAGGDVKISSPTALAKHWKVGNTQKETLRDFIASGHPAAFEMEIALAWRKAAKLLTTYLRPLVGKDRLTGLFNPAPSEDRDAPGGGTTTGRLSSERSNLQNLDPRLQVCLRGPEGFLLRRADFNQLELRCAAEISGDPYLIEVLRDPERDIHQETAELLGLDRSAAKRFNFKVLYGGGSEGGEAGEALFRRHRSQWRVYYSWADAHWAEVQRTGYSESPFGHRRPIPLMAGGDHARKAAINHPSQAMAVYITKRAMLEMWRQGCVLVNQIHDEIHDYVPENEAKDLQLSAVCSIMQEVGEKYLPRTGIRVKASVGRYWEEDN